MLVPYMPRFYMLSKRQYRSRKWIDAICMLKVTVKEGGLIAASHFAAMWSRIHDARGHHRGASSVRCSTRARPRRRHVPADDGTEVTLLQTSTMCNPRVARNPRPCGSGGAVQEIDDDDACQVPKAGLGPRAGGARKRCCALSRQRVCAIET